MAASDIDATALAVIASTPAVLRALLERVATEAGLDQPRDEGWSVKDVVAHLLDADGIAFSERIARIVAEDRPYIRSIDPTARIEAAGYARRGAGDLVGELEERRAAHTERIRSLSAGELARTGEHDHAGEISASDIVHQWAYHDLMHLRQIAAMLQSGLTGRMGNTRRFYDV